MKLRYDSFCDKGRIREKNEDSVLVWQNRSETLAVFLVADGMGGHYDGEKASALIVQTIEQWLNLHGEEEHTFAEISDTMRNLLQDANTEIFETLNQGRICGSTVALLVVSEEGYICFSTGDSRIYRSRGMGLEQITQDDIWDNKKTVREKFTPEEIARHPNHGKLSYAVGTTARLHYTMHSGEVRRWDRFALCSDGVYKSCEEGSIQKMLRRLWWRKPKTLCRQMLDTVYQNGATDNATLILVRCG